KGYSLLRALTTSWNDAPERASRPFSADRDGFVLAEGSWMFVVEEYEHAVDRGERIYGEIAGYVCTCEALNRVRMRESAEERDQGACGAAGIAATLVAMEHGRIPPTINLEVPDPECDLDYVPEPGRTARIEHAICNCVGFGSKNSALVLRKIA